MGDTIDGVVVVDRDGAEALPLLFRGAGAWGDLTAEVLGAGAVLAGAALFFAVAVAAPLLLADGAAFFAGVFAAGCAGAFAAVFFAGAAFGALFAAVLLAAVSFAALPLDPAAPFRAGTVFFDAVRAAMLHP